MTQKWQNEAEFLAGFGNGGRAWMPAKHVHVDTDSQPPAESQCAGQLYEDRLSEVSAADPPLLCPSCGRHVFGIVGATGIHQTDVKETGGKTHKGDIPPCPVKGPVLPAMHYSVGPCGCKVSQEWAGDFAAEQNNRLRGGKPRAVVGLTEERRLLEVEQLTDMLTRLYKHQASLYPADVGRMKVCAYWIKVVADRIQTLCPGTHNSLPAAGKVPTQGASYANASAPPPGEVSKDFGYGANYPMPKKTAGSRVKAHPDDAVDKSSTRWPGHDKPKVAIEPAAAPRQLNFFGATPEEQAGFLAGVVSKSGTAPVWPVDLVNKIYDAIPFNEGLFYSLLKQVTRSIDTLTLVQEMSTLRKDMCRFLDAGGGPLLVHTVDFLSAVCNHVSVEKLPGTSTKVPGVKPEAAVRTPASDEPPCRHVKKRRTIRIMGE
jgi:hypothetical protein